MARPTIEVRKATEALHLAILDLARAKGWAKVGSVDTPALLTDWVVIATLQGYDSEGDMNTAALRLEGPNEEMPWHAILGLLRMGTLLAENNFREDDPDSD
jgi:hypothetical protein